MSGQYKLLATQLIEMKLKIIISIASLTYLFSCVGTMKVFTDFDPDYSLKNFKTFGWSDSKQLEVKGNPLYYNELNDKRIKKEVELQMTGKGYQLAATNPGLIMHYHFVLENRQVINPDPFGDYGSYWLNRNVNGYEFREGTLIIDLMDPKTNNLVWRGWAVGFLDEERPDQMGKQIKHAIQNIFAKF